MKYQKFRKMDSKKYLEVTRFLKRTTHLTAREWVIAHLCADFKDASNRSEMTWIGSNLKELVPFMEEEYTRQEVSNARAVFKKRFSAVALPSFMHIMQASLHRKK